MHQDHIRLYFLQDSFNTVQNIGRDVKQGLLVLHNRQVIVWHHMKCLQHLIQHLPMLAGHADDSFNVIPDFQFVD